VKDLIDVAGQPATSGSRVLAGRIAEADAQAIARLRAQGAVLIGKVATYEFAMVGPDLTLPDPPARNPWNPAHITGGSSSGSAAAVAGGLIRLAIGTDTGGSIRSPAAYCGSVGLKPTYDRTSRAGAFPLSPSLDHTGPLAATVEEAALALDAMTESASWRPASSRIGQPITGLKIAYARDWFADDPQASPALIRAMDEAASTLSLLGAQITLVTLPDYAPYEAAASIILHAEALEEHRALIGAERAVIFAEHRRGASQREIARLLGRSASTICRELARGRVARIGGRIGGGSGSGYCPQAASAPMRGGGCAADPGASSSRAGRCGASSGTGLSHSAGRPSRSPRHSRPCTPMNRKPA
jgi:Asp-tRNA(Asn)/Glu-tRNA(Gln) amidotransferase A subunit family amidase